MAIGSLALSPSFRWFSSVALAFTTMLDEIGKANRSIRLEMYIYTDGLTGRKFREALTAAAARGVQVQVLVDALGSLTLAESFWEPLISAGGKFSWFNPLQLNRLAIRNHRKLLVCDDRIAFVGGFNIADEYDGDGVSQGWFDLGLQLTGSLVAELSASFDSMFALADFRHKRFVRLRRARFSNVVEAADGQLLLAAPGLGRNFLKSTLLLDLEKAHSVDIISAYFLPTRAIRQGLKRVVRRGGRVRLLLAGKSDVAMSKLASQRFYQDFLKAGVEIYEYQPQILHAKLLVIDGAVYVGSANLDRRSLFINYELLLRLPNQTLAEEARLSFQGALSNSTQIKAAQWRSARSFWSKLRERWAFFILAQVDPYIARRQVRNLQLLR